MIIKSALISVFDKTGIDKLALELAKNGVVLYSTGGTKKYLEKSPNSNVRAFSFLKVKAGIIFAKVLFRIFCVA